MSEEKNRGTLQGNVKCTYSEPGLCLLTVSASPFMGVNKGKAYINLPTITCNNFGDYAELYPSSELVESGDLVIRIRNKAKEDLIMVMVK